MFRLTNIPVQKSAKNFQDPFYKWSSFEFPELNWDAIWSATAATSTATETLRRATATSDGRPEFYRHLEELYQNLERDGRVSTEFTISSRVYTVPHSFTKRVELIAIERPRVATYQPDPVRVSTPPARYTVVYLTDLDVTGIPERIR